MDRFLPRTIHARLIASHLLVALVGIILVSLLAGRTTYFATLDRAEHNYENLAFAASNELEDPLAEYLAGSGSAGQIHTVVDKWFSQIPGYQYTLYLPSGEPLLASRVDLPPNAGQQTDPEVWLALEDELGRSSQIRPNSDGIETLYLAVRVSHEDQNYGILRLEIPVQAALVPARRSLTLLLLTNLIVALGVSVFASLLSRSLSSPIKNLTHTAERVAKGELGARAPSPAGPRELHRLADSFNIMAARLQSNLDELRTFVSNASHELRTPLTSVKLRVEALRSGALEDPTVADRFLSEIESEVDRLSRMVNDMLDLSRIDAGLASRERVPLHLSNVAGEVCETFRARAERLGVSLKLSVEHGLPWIMGNEDQLRRMLYNLVDNAIKYTTRGGRVDLVIRMDESGSYLVMMVKDTGYGITPKHLPHIFERFYRAEATRPRYGPPQGSGLGLSIAKSIVEMHGGRISVASEIGKGTTFTVELPTRVVN